MRTRILWLLLGLLLVGVLALGSLGVVLTQVHTSQASSGMMSGKQQSMLSHEMSGLGITHVFMRNDTYQPTHIQVPVGTVVTWTNEDDVPHGVTIAHSVVSINDIWESGLLSTGQSFSYVFTSPGTYTYYCSEHPSVMTGVVVVMG
jgi:plastocyanin